MEAKTGDTVKVHYQGRLKDGLVFDDSAARNEPLTFTVGQGHLIPGFDRALVGMQPGQAKTIELSPQDGYGDHRDELVLTVNRAELPSEITPVLGLQLQLTQDNEQYTVVTISEINGDRITLDANHPLAGKTLVFDIKLVEISPPCSCCG